MTVVDDTIARDINRFRDEHPALVERVNILKIEVDGIKVDIAGVRTQIESRFDKLTEQIVGFGRPQWPVYISGLALTFSIIVVIGSMAFTIMSSQVSGILKISDLNDEWMRERLHKLEEQYTPRTTFEAYTKLRDNQYSVQQEINKLANDAYVSTKAFDSGQKERDKLIDSVIRSIEVLRNRVDRLETSK